ncbi:MAG TPA: PAS domain S-box protein, partial [Deferrisomatales bacterium]|nr:PAS domain S-box protein [Deferrisomatales bacterium]
MSRLIPWKQSAAPNTPDAVEMGELRRRVEALTAENEGLHRDLSRAQLYIRSRTDRLLEAAGTIPLRPEELDDATLLELDPIGIVAETFAQILEHSKKTNAALRVAHGEMAAVFDSVGAGILVLDTDHRICSYNREAAEKLLGGDPLPEGRPCYQVICDRTAPVEVCTLKGALRTRDTYRRRDWVNRGRHYDVIATPLRGRDGEIAQVVLVYLDITERLLAQQALETSETRYRDLVENAHDLIQSVRLDGCFEFVNEAWRRRLGYSEQDLETLTLFDVVDPEHHTVCRDLMARLARGEQVPHVEVQCRTKAGDRVVLEGNINCISVDDRMVATRAIFRDVTELRQTREESARVERLESVGLLAGGIAHDFNNLLTAMLHNLTLVRTDLPGISHPRL